MLQNADEDCQRERHAILRTGTADAGRWYRQLESLERQRADYQRVASLEGVDLADFVARTAELNRKRDHVKKLLSEQERLKDLEEDHKTTVELIRRG